MGHSVTLLSSILFLLSYVRVFPSASLFWYKTALFGVLESFGVLIYQTISKNGFSVTQLPRDDNVQYFGLGLVLFVYSPYVALTLSTFMLFSTFHVLSYVKHHLLPAFGITDSHPVSARIGEFISANNNGSIALASLLEVYTAGWLFLRVITFRKVSMIPFLGYVVFLKFRFEKSLYTRNAFKSVEVRIDDLVNMTGQPVVTDAWVKVKTLFYRLSAITITGESKQKKTN